MLTYPSDSLPQIVCQMDEEAIPSNPLCSAPPHSDPPPPLLPLPFTSPSCSNDGVSEHRESGRTQAQMPKKQSGTDSVSTQRQREERMDGSNFIQTTECQNNQKDQRSTQEKTDVFVTESQQFTQNSTENHTDAPKFDLDTCRVLAVGHTAGNASAPKGWVIGPLFQSFKSKMASFTEIVMSPVKLFRATSPQPSVGHPEDEIGAIGTADVKHSEQFYPKIQSELGNMDTQDNQEFLCDDEIKQPPQIINVKYCKRLFNMESPTHGSENEDEWALSAKERGPPDFVSLEQSSLPCFVSENVSDSDGSDIRSSVLSQPSMKLSASHECTLKESSIGDRKAKQPAMLKPLPRKRTGNRSQLNDVTAKKFPLRKEGLDDVEKSVPYPSSFYYSQPDTDCLQLYGDDNATKNERSLMPVDQMDYSGASFGRGKRGLKLHCHSQDLAKRKKVTTEANMHTDDTKSVTSDIGISRRLRPTRKKSVSSNTVEDMKEPLMPTRKTQTRANRKEKAGFQDWLPVVNEARGKSLTESSSDAVLVCSLDKSDCVSENNQKNSSIGKMKWRASCKREELGTCIPEPDVITENRMGLDSTVEMCSAKQPEQVFWQDHVCADIKQLCRPSKCRNTSRKPLKRKQPIQASSVVESVPLISTSSILSVEPPELATNSNTSGSGQRKDNLRTASTLPSKKSKNALRGYKSSDSGEATNSDQCFNIGDIPKESHSHRGQMSVDPVYFEMTPIESSTLPAPSSIHIHSDCFVLVNDEVRYTDGKREVSTSSVVNNTFPTDISVSRLRSSARRVEIKPKRPNNQSRKRVLHSRTCKDEGLTNSVAIDDVDVAKPATQWSENRFSRRLLRSYSCPEIPTLHSQDTLWTASLHSPHPYSSPSSNQHQSFHSLHVPRPPKPIRRARRHTVCSVEVEREIAPLCLRKEVYPTRRSFPYGNAIEHLSVSLALSPSTTLSALASCFLSSPLAFLSKKAESRGSVTSPSSSSHVSPPTSLDSSISGGILLESKTERRQQCDEEEEYGENTSSSSQEFEDVGLREEKALSDSEIKAVQKNEQRRKVSSIRIRKTLPKPQNNLTPMGLPKPIRLKKKEFSLEEIYTNKNFSKPPESRLETIFEEPLNRRNGSESWFGQRRVKRFLEFLEAGEVRKPRKPLVGVGKTGTSSSRTRRGGFTKDEPSLTVQDVDSLLCAKLDELNLWLMHDQKNS